MYYGVIVERRYRYEISDCRRASGSGGWFIEDFDGKPFLGRSRDKPSAVNDGIPGSCVVRHGGLPSDGIKFIRLHPAKTSVILGGPVGVGGGGGYVGDDRVKSSYFRCTPL